MRSRLAFACLGLLAAAAQSMPHPLAASTIGVYFAADGTDCDAIVPQNTPIAWYVLAVLGGDPAAAGIRGAAIRVTGVPTSWFGNPTPSPIVPVAPPGNLLVEGVELVFPTCQTGSAGGVVLLYTVFQFATSAPANLVFQVEPPTTPPYVGFTDPVLVLCDSPTFTRICVQGTPGFVNGQTPCFFDLVPPPQCPTVAVEGWTWTTLKRIYLN